MSVFYSHFIKLQLLLILVAVFAGVFYPEILQKIKIRFFEYLEEQLSLESIHKLDPKDIEKLFTKSELSKYNGEDGVPIYLALLGSVYDVTKGRKHYGSGCTYNFFVGRDASVSFVSGNFDSFDEETADDVNTLKSADLLSLEYWKSFYDQQYSRKGKLVGRFYNKNGLKTKYHEQFDALLEEARIAKKAADDLRDLYPDCNIEWSEATGTRVWCTNSSGGKHRNWYGYPRKYFEPGKDSFRCVCVQSEDLAKTSAMIKPYDNCHELSSTCFYDV